MIWHTYSDNSAAARITYGRVLRARRLKSAALAIGGPLPQAGQQHGRQA